MLSNEKFQELVNRARDFNAYTVSYTQSVLWGERNQETSIKDIALAVEIARGEMKPRTTGELFDILSDSLEYKTAINELIAVEEKFKALHNMVVQRYQADHQIRKMLLNKMRHNLTFNIFGK